MGHPSYVLLCTETTLSNPPVVQPKSSCDVHLLRSPWITSSKTCSRQDHHLRWPQLWRTAACPPLPPPIKVCRGRSKAAAATVVMLLLCQVDKNFTRLQAHTVQCSASIFTRVKWDMEFLTEEIFLNWHMASYLKLVNLSFQSQFSTSKLFLLLKKELFNL